MKKALVLGGGGTKGAYQYGAIRALEKLNYKFDIVTGTSIGALNGCLYAQNDLDRLYDLWQNLKMEDILADKIPDQYDIETLVNNNNLISTFFKNYVKEKGADITPFKNNIANYFDYDHLMASNIDFGLVTVNYPSLKPEYVLKKDLTRENGCNYLLASASCFPAFPICHFDNKAYIDGGYYDNCPIELAFEMGADSVVAVDLTTKAHHEEYLNFHNITYIIPTSDLGMFLNFDKNTIMRNMILGFHDTYKAFGIYHGHKYTFKSFNGYDILSKKLYSSLIRLDSLINKETIRSKKRYIFDCLKEKNNKAVLSYEDVMLSIVDHFLEMYDYDVCEIYDLDLVLNEIIDRFKCCKEADYEFMPRNILDIADYIKGLSKHMIVEKLVYQLLYPDNAKLNDSIILTLFPMEKAMALFVVLLMGGIKE